MTPRPVWTGFRKSGPHTGIRSPDRPPRSESIYRLSYRGPFYVIYVIFYIFICYVFEHYGKTTIEKKRPLILRLAMHVSFVYKIFALTCLMMA